MSAEIFNACDLRASQKVVQLEEWNAAQADLSSLREELAVERGRLNYLQDNWVSVSCRVANTGFCGPRGREWECYVYAAGPRDPKSAEGETLREAIDAMQTLNKQQGGKL